MSDRLTVCGPHQCKRLPSWRAGCDTCARRILGVVYWRYERWDAERYNFRLWFRCVACHRAAKEAT